MNPPCLSPHKEGVVLAVRVTPKSSRTRILGLHGDALKLSLQAPPSEGQANRELIAFLAKTFSLPKCRIDILSGELSRHKKLLLREVSLDGISRLLEPFLSK